LTIHRVGGLSGFLVLILLLAACGTVPHTAVEEKESARLYASRHDRLAASTSWALDGRLAVSNEEDGGSGNFRWSQAADSNRMDFHGALGRGAWRLTAKDGGAELELSDGTVHRAGTIDELVQSQLGWTVPVDNLSWWVRGMSAPGSYHRRTLDEAGRLLELHQGGWSIEYGRYRSFNGVDLPVKVVATRAEWKVKLGVRGWAMSAEAD